MLILAILIRSSSRFAAVCGVPVSVESLNYSDLVLGKWTRVS